jgi:hypothetical protein
MKINFIRHRKQTPLLLQRRAANYVEGNDQPLVLGILFFAKGPPYLSSSSVRISPPVGS